MTRKAKALPRTVAPLEFINDNPIFTLEQFQEAYRRAGRSVESAPRALEYHLKEYRIVSVRRGLYVHNKFIDPWSLVPWLADDAVISHDGALSFHKLTGLGHRVSFTTSRRIKEARLNDVIYAPIRKTTSRSMRTIFVDHQLKNLMVTSVPATLVDCLALLERAPPLTELMEVFIACAKTVDASEMIAHALQYDSPLLASRLGFFLMCARFNLEPAQWRELSRKGVRVSTYFRRSERTEREAFIARWNLLVPEELVTFWLDAFR